MSAESNYMSNRTSILAELLTSMTRYNPICHVRGKAIWE